MNPLKLGLVIADPKLLNEVQTCIRALPVRVLFEQSVVSDTAAFLDQIEQHRPEVLLIDLTRLSEPFENVVRRIRSCSAPPLIIAMSDTADPEVILGAIRAGANEFLYPPLSAGLVTALERLSGERAKAHGSGGRHRGRTLGFVSAKGGCGATTVACHMAVEIQKATGQEVLLADLDMDSGLIGFLMKSKSTYTILDAVKNVHRLDGSYWKALVSNGHPNLEVIAAPLAATQREPLDADQFRTVLRFTRSTYDWVLTDLGRSLSQLAAGVIEEIDDTYVICTQDLPALHQARQVVQSLLDAGYSRNRLHLVMNRMPKRPDFEPAQIQKALGIPVFEMLPNDYPALFEAYSEGNLLNGSSDLAKSLSALALKVAGAQPAREKSKGKLNLSFF